MREQFLPAGTVVLLLLIVVLPTYFFVTAQFGYMVPSLVVGGVLAVVKWRWWWEPLKRLIPDG